jgi:molybdate transport system regulatory protein
MSTSRSPLSASSPRVARRQVGTAPLQPSLRLTLRLDVGGRATLGPGKVRLLELIGETGSISAAGRAMGMSYRRAWALVESLNTAFTGPLVAARPGGAGGGGADLLPLGTEIVQLYRTLERQALTTGAAELARLRSVLALSV